MRSTISLLLLLTGLLAARAFSQQSGADEADRKKAFLKAKEEMRTVPLATPAPATAPKPKPRAVAPPAPTPRPPEPEPQPEPKPKAQPERQAPPRPAVSPAPRTRESQSRSSSTTRRRATPLLVITPKPAPVTPAPSRQRDLPVAVTVQKSGFEEAEIVPAERSRGGWFFGGPKYKYLTAAVRAEIDRAPVRKGRWRYTVVHNSATRQGSAKAFDYYHLRVRKMPNGLAYHFVIGNGTSTGDGQIEVGNRWRRQINGGHVHSDYLNNIALGICLVGDYNRDLPTKKQLEALDELITYLRRRVGKVEGKQSIVKPHKDINPPRWATDCPGDRFPYRWLRTRFN